MGAVEPFGIRETLRRKTLGNPVGRSRLNAVERSFKRIVAVCLTGQVLDLKDRLEVEV